MAVHVPPQENLVYQLKESPYSSHSQILSLFPANGEGKRVLDVGCANGYLAAILAARGYDVVGVERPGGFGSDFPQNVRLVVADLDRGLPALDGCFDYIVAADILEHVRDPRTLLLQLAEVSAPTTRLIASLPNSGNIYFRLVVLSGRFPKEEKGLFDRTHVHFFTWDGWMELFAESGCQLATSLCTGIPVGLAVPRWSHSFPVRVAERVSYELARLWKTLFAYQFVVSAKLRLDAAEGDSFGKKE